MRKPTTINKEISRCRTEIKKLNKHLDELAQEYRDSVQTLLPTCLYYYYTESVNPIHHSIPQDVQIAFCVYRRLTNFAQIEAISEENKLSYKYTEVSSDHITYFIKHEVLGGTLRGGYLKTWEIITLEEIAEIEQGKVPLRFLDDKLLATSVDSPFIRGYES